MIAPAIAAAGIILYYAIYFGVLIALLNGIWKYLLGIIPLVLSALIIKVCIERFQEIKEGEEDDLGQY